MKTHTSDDMKKVSKSTREIPGMLEHAVLVRGRIVAYIHGTCLDDAYVNWKKAQPRKIGYKYVTLHCYSTGKSRKYASYE